MNPSKNQKLIDVACGTGDIAKLFLKSVNDGSHITCVDPNKGMIATGKKKLKNYKNLNWVISSAENLPIDNNKFDFYTISFGLRNTKNLEQALKEAHRVLKPNGTLGILEFSKSKYKIFSICFNIYFHYILPFIGKLISGSNAYKYLPESVVEFASRDELLKLMKKTNFQKCYMSDLTFGITTIFIGKKNNE